MKKWIMICVAAALLLSCAACGAAPAQEPLSGTPEELLAQLKERVELPLSMDSAVTAELAPGAAGLTAAEFEEYVVAAAESAAMISAQAQTAVLLQCKDPAAAALVKQRIAAGFDSGKWICVFPEQSLVMEAGSYVLLAAGTKDSTDALAAAFDALCDGQAGAPNIFYTFDMDGTGDALDPGIDSEFGGSEDAGEAETFTDPALGTDPAYDPEPADPSDDGGIIAF